MQDQDTEAPSQPNFRTESWRRERTTQFTNAFERTMHQVGEVVGNRDEPEIITNKRWKRSLLEMGFTEDSQREDVVYKSLT